MKVLVLWWSDFMEIYVEGGYYGYAFDNQPLKDINCLEDREVELYCYGFDIYFDVPYLRSFTSDNFVYIADYCGYSFEIITDALQFFSINPDQCEYIHIMCQNWILSEGNEFIDAINFVLYYGKNKDIAFWVNEFIYRKSYFSMMSMFSGWGGFDLPFYKQGFEIAWANDNDKFACLSYRQNFPNVNLIEKNIREVTEFEFPRRADILIGGYPCQGFSEAGTQCLDDSRNLLYKHFKRGLRIVRPKMFIAENVRGLLTMGGGKVIKRMIQEFEKENYNVSCKLLNAKDFGVPQDRLRTFIVGIHNDLDIEFSFPTATYGIRRLPYKTLKDAIWDFKDSPGEFYKGWRPDRFLTRQRKRPWNRTSFCIVATPWNNPLHPSGKLMRPISFDAKGRGNLFEYSGLVNRSFSIKEIKAIQTFPQNFRVLGSLKDQYRQIGNSVPFLLGQKFATSIKKALVNEVHGVCNHKVDIIKKRVNYIEFLVNQGEFKRLILCEDCLDDDFKAMGNHEIFIVNKHIFQN